jgi:hypothetical protein
MSKKLSLNFYHLEVEITMFIIGMITVDLNVDANAEPWQSHLAVDITINYSSGSSRKARPFLYFSKNIFNEKNGVFLNYYNGIQMQLSPEQKVL